MCCKDCCKFVLLLFWIICLLVLYLNFVWFYWYKVYFFVVKKRNFGFICVNIYIIYSLFDNKVLKGFLVVNIIFMYIFEFVVFDLNFFVLCVCICNVFVFSLKEMFEVLCVLYILVVNLFYCFIFLFKIVFFCLWGVNNLKVNVICVFVVIYVVVILGYVLEVVLFVWYFWDDILSW